MTCASGMVCTLCATLAPCAARCVANVDGNIPQMRCRIFHCGLYGLLANSWEFALRVCFKCAAGVVCQAPSRRNICRGNFTSQTFRIASANFAFGQGRELRLRTNCSGRPCANIDCAKTNGRIATSRARRAALSGFYRAAERFYRADKRGLFRGFAKAALWTERKSLPRRRSGFCERRASANSAGYTRRSGRI